jgi:probable addiction module antidote protein
MKKTANYQAFLIEQLRNNEDFCEEYLNEALRDEDQRLILMAIRNVAQATGGLTRLAKNTGLNRQNLYRTLSKEGNPTWQRIEKIFDGLGYPLRAISKKNISALEGKKAISYLSEHGKKISTASVNEKVFAYGKPTRGKRKI